MKKRILYVIACLTFIFVINAVVVYATGSEYLGDVDGNGKVTAADARVILRHSANLENVADSCAHLADINGDEKIVAADARITLRMSAKLEDLFKFGEEYHLHNYESAILKNAICTQEGQKQDICSSCGDTKVSTIEKTGHCYTEATCTKPQTCEICGMTQGSVKEHNYVTTSSSSAATCKDCGVTSCETSGHAFSHSQKTKNEKHHG